MIIVRFKETFRDRSSEWAMSAGMLGWGLLTLSSPGVFEKWPIYHLMLNIMSQTSWGVMIALVGLTRLVFLVINGAWRPSAHIRACGCVMGAILWSTLFMSSISLETAVPLSALYAAVLSIDLLALWFTAGDAKLADLSARGNQRA